MNVTYLANSRHYIGVVTRRKLNVKEEIGMADRKTNNLKDDGLWKVKWKVGRFKETVYVGIESVRRRNPHPDPDHRATPVRGCVPRNWSSNPHPEIGNPRRLRT